MGKIDGPKKLREKEEGPDSLLQHLRMDMEKMARPNFGFGGIEKISFYGGV